MSKQWEKDPETCHFLKWQQTKVSISWQNTDLAAIKLSQMCHEGHYVNFLEEFHRCAMKYIMSTFMRNSIVWKLLIYSRFYTTSRPHWFTARKYSSDRVGDVIICSKASTVSVSLATRFFYKQWFFRTRLRCCLAKFPKIGLTLPDKKKKTIICQTFHSSILNIFRGFENWQISA